jgi:hypothetical protein
MPTQLIFGEIKNSRRICLNIYHQVESNRSEMTLKSFNDPEFRYYLVTGAYLHRTRSNSFINFEKNKTANPLK